MRDPEAFPIVLAEIYRTQSKINSNNMNRENKEMEKIFPYLGHPVFYGT